MVSIKKKRKQVVGIFFIESMMKKSLKRLVVGLIMKKIIVINWEMG
ncbi:unnamed protein product [Paramecium primaurelia]|uniref:Uncharacterized protein n=1 Tax=Paramecium primaurelia TaxID=5886 RepID=A0A8S1LKG7_PARPR|nr:unnamed protein product [Paramecium primaurelia]